MQINELAKRSGVSAKTIRYYEEIELLPPARRKPNGYRDYVEADVERLRLVAGARRLDFPLSDIKEILDLRDRNIPPCSVMLDLLERKAEEIADRILELEQLQHDLEELYAKGKTFPLDDVEGKNCVCHLVTTHRETGVSINHSFE